MYSPSTGKFFRFLRSRGFRLALLAFQFLWLNIIVPGHRRGIVTLPGTQCPACEAQTALTAQPVEPVRACCSHHSKMPPTVPAGNADHCAICFFAARLSPAVAVDFTHPPLRLVAVLDAPQALIAHSPQFALTYHGRAPPLSA